MTIKEYKGQRVITFKDVDSVHNRPQGTSKRNFNTNRKYFIEGKDYIVRNSYEAKKEFKTVAPNGLTLLTESGYLMLVKSLTDDLAWKVQRELVNNYFRVKPHGEPRQLTFDDYSYFDKTFRGQPVLSTADIANMTRSDRSTISYAVRKYLTSGKDYYFLEKGTLAEFKVENPKVYRHIGAMHIITQSGFDKLCRIYGIKIEKPELFIEKKLESRAYLPSREMKSLIGYLDSDMILINEYCRRILNASDIEEAEQSRNGLVKAIRSLRQFTVDVECIAIK